MSKKCADTQDDYCNPPPTLGLITTAIAGLNCFSFEHTHTCTVHVRIT